jgi:hypothetical protein
VGSKGVNRKTLTFEEHGNFLELDETHSWEEGDPQGAILMDEPRNANVEEATSNFAKKTTSLICTQVLVSKNKDIKVKKKSC